VEQARKLPTGALGRMIDELPVRLGAAGGDLAKLALSEKLVDALMTRDELRALLIKRGAEDPAHKTFRQVSFQEYRYGLPDSGDRSTQVAVVVVQGDIVDGDAPQGAIGGRSTAELIRHARDDDTVKALVLRVDSPGGSAFGAELIRRELEITRKAGKPVIVSMSDVAASGGYWVSTSADEVLADPATITRLDRRIRAGADVRQDPGQAGRAHRRRDDDLVGGRAGSAPAAGPALRPGDPGQRRPHLPGVSGAGRGQQARNRGTDRGSGAGTGLDWAAGARTPPGGRLWGFGCRHP